MAAKTSSGSALVTLPTDTQILISREFDAPKHLVYKAWSTPELVKRWWWGDGSELTEVKIDLRVGGSYRYLMKADDGVEHVYHGEYQEIVPNERVVSTEIHEGRAEEEALSTDTFTEEDGRTLLTVLI